MKLIKKAPAILLMAVLLLSTATQCKKSKNEIKPTFKVKEDGLYAEIQTSKGNILAKLEMNKTPLTVTNFVGLAEGTISNTFKQPGEPFYDGLVFHRVINNFMIQGGDPTGSGAGGPGYKFADEILPGDLVHDTSGILSMANSGPHTNGSQFFITHNATPWLNGAHTIFGHVVEGIDVVNAIKQGDTIKHVLIIREGKEAKDFVANDETFEALKANAKEANKERYRTYVKSLAEKMANGDEIKEVGENMYVIIREQGNGPLPKKGQTVTAKYHGKFDDGRTFDKGEYSFELETGSVIEGWHLGFAQLHKGAKATFVIPYWHGYGERAQFQGQMPARSTLIFDVELLDIK